MGDLVIQAFTFGSETGPSLHARSLKLLLMQSGVMFENLTGGFILAGFIQMPQLRNIYCFHLLNITRMRTEIFVNNNIAD
jgi:hypothetical protein